YRASVREHFTPHQAVGELTERHVTAQDPPRMIVRNPTELGATIRDRRRRLRLPQHDLAAKVGVSRQWIIEVKKGKSGAEIGLVFRTLAALGIAFRVTEEGS